MNIIWLNQDFPDFLMDDGANLSSKTDGKFLES